MRVILALPLLMLFSACEADVDRANDSVTLEYNENLAENTVEDISSGAQNLAGQVANDVGETADRVQNEVGEVDVDVDADVDTGANADANAADAN